MTLELERAMMSEVNRITAATFSTASVHTAVGPLTEDGLLSFWEAMQPRLPRIVLKVSNYAPKGVYLNLTAMNKAADQRAQERNDPFWPAFKYTDEDERAGLVEYHVVDWTGYEALCLAFPNLHDLCEVQLPKMRK